MKKITKTFFAAALCMAAVALTSCRKDDTPSQKDIETKIIGKWKSHIVNGELCITNLRSVNTYTTSGVKYVSLSKYSESKGGWMWSNNVPYTYSVEGNTINEERAATKVKFEVEIKAIDEHCFEYSKTNLTEDYKGDRHSTGIMVKVDNDFSKDIIGLWEGQKVTGSETYGNADHRIEYKADGTYDYYDKSGDTWVLSSDTGNEYNVDGDWLATRWCPTAESGYKYEWWDIDSIKDGTMEWSALRQKEDGSYFTTTFTWKRIK